MHKSEKEAFKQLDNVIIIRPGVIIGGGDIFMKRLLPIFKASFFVPLFGDGSTKFQPVFSNFLNSKRYIIDKYWLEFC